MKAVWTPGRFLQEQAWSLLKAAHLVDYLNVWELRVSLTSCMFYFYFRNSLLRQLQSLTRVCLKVNEEFLTHTFRM